MAVTDEPIPPSTETPATRLVVIGASAGGLQALRPLVARLEPQAGIAWVLAQHLSPTQPSLLVQLLAAQSRLDVLAAEDGMPLRDKCLLVCPPGVDICIDGERVLLVAPTDSAYSVPSIDRLFASAAASHGAAVVAVVLSGAGNDGSAGVAAVRAAGGTVIVQQPDEALQRGMPSAVLAAAQADLCGGIAEIAGWLNAIASTRHRGGDDGGVFQELLHRVAQETGLDVGQYKENTLRRQTLRRLRGLGYDTLAQYLEHVRREPQELVQLQQCFMISVSSFFRDAGVFAALELALRPLVMQRHHGDSIRVWVPACASGEEAYSIAIVLAELLGERLGQFDVRVFATDIDREALDFARSGRYPAEAVAMLDPQRRQRWFVQQDRHWRVVKTVRDLCVFSAHDVLRHPPFIHMDLISCRNLLIYFKPQQQEELLGTFHHALNGDGLLLLGKSESTGFGSRLFETLDPALKLYRRRPGPSPQAGKLARFGMVPLGNAVISPKHAGAARQQTLGEAAQAMIVREYGPPGVLVNSAFEPLHFFGRSQRYFALPTDGADFSVFALCIPELRAELKAMAYRWMQETVSEIRGCVSVVRHGEEEVRVRPVLRRVTLATPGTGEAFLICFEETPSGLGCLTEAEIDADDERAALRKELADTREHLQAVIEELEASNEELQSLNEEIQSSSEELQSSNEELQSSNEELSTLNDELRAKSIEAMQLNAVLANVQNSIQMGLVVVDRDGRVTRFNTLAVRVFGLVDKDIGQFIYGIPSRIELPQLRARIAAVVAGGSASVERVHAGEFHYLMQVAPYIDELGERAGALLSFTDVSELQRAEEAHRSSEARFHHVWDACLEGLVVVDAQGRIVLVNPAAQRMFGYGPDELPGLGIERLVPEDLGAQHGRHRLQYMHGPALARPMGQLNNIRGRRADGSTFPVEVGLSRFSFEGVGYALASVSDISERRAAELALRDSEMRLRLALDAAHAGYWQWELASGDLFWSERLWSMYGLEQPLPQPSFADWCETLDPRDRERVTTEVLDATQAGRDLEIDWRVNLPPGHPERWLFARGRALFDESGRLDRYLGIVLDISERKLAAERRQRSEALAAELGLLHELLDSTLAGYWDWNLTADTEYFSPTFKRMLGYADDELEHRPQALQALIFPEDRVKLETLFERHVRSRGRERYYGEVRYRHKGGSTVWVICAGRVVQWGEQGEPLRMVGCHIDITRQRELELERARESEARVSAILDNVGACIYIKDRDYRYTYVNTAVSELTGMSADRILGCDDTAFFDAATVAGLRANDRRVIEDGERVEIEETHFQADDGLQRTFLSIKLPLRRQSGEIYALCGISTDITEHKRVEARLGLAASVFTHAQEGIMITDDDGVMLDVNATFTRITGYTRDEAVGRNANLLCSGRHGEDFYTAMWSALIAEGRWQGEIWNRRKNGDVYPQALNIAAVRDGGGDCRYYVALFADISEQKEHQRQLEHIAHFDILTGLPNRFLLADRLQQGIAHARRRNTCMALVYLDLDGFKAVNDSYGHEVGDRLLIAISQRLHETLRAADTLARLGGDEFVAVLNDLTTPEEYVGILERLLQAAAGLVDIDGLRLQLSASCGVTLFPEDNGDADTLLRHADQAMYQAKLAGKNRYHLFDPESDRQTRTQRENLQRIAEALERREFVLYYQPKVNMRSGEVVGAEALIRWQHPQRGLLPPLAFLPVIENTPLIARVGDWVLDTALEQLDRWHASGLELSVSVNIAAAHLQQEDFLPRLREKLARHPTLPHHSLELEVLETAALDDIGRISQFIHGCRALGVSFSLDDFGTGYASLTYLKRLPATVLKIDQSFVRDMLWDAEDLAIVEGVVGLARTFHREVIAEGVETAEHGELLLRLGCELAQGYGIARPMPAQDLPAWAASWQPAASWEALRELPPVHEELPLVYAEAQVRHWLHLLDAATDTVTYLPPLQVWQDRLGRWLDGEGQQLCGTLEVFQAFRGLHERVMALVPAAEHSVDASALAAFRELCAQLLQVLPALALALRQRS
ncbi:PAS domain S-box protein [Plasticicumulans acidivorans]|uniref:protein-glutamate O-methyltransferase n=1 Tax=Plasticicumulans acidivorans TaxID=886464 RepID=A0A317MZD4_9GAMM|nr:PAS domain S-box protein [Plasticicumulans acidivorans]PWV65526.1 PAS domain S-box-containing protein/diguanylate cyclase (GGDEF)-like protein [Plasticicumulans acidivorans]